MDTLESLIEHAPDWIKRLDELHGQIEQRQQDLARLEEAQPSSSARSIRNQGSTESLRPKDEGAVFPTPDAPRAEAGPSSPVQRRPTPQQEHTPKARRDSSSPGSDPKTPSSIQRQTKEVVATAQRRARAVLRKRQKTESMISGEGVAPTYRTRSMIIVYYDSYVQSFFEELVKFVSAQRNLMRKAKMAAKVAEIKRLAELEMPDDSDDDVDDPLRPGDALIAADPKIAARSPRGSGAEDLQLRYTSTRMMASRQMSGAGRGLDVLHRGLGGTDQGPKDVYDELDRSLESVQGMCEKAAHQFLRDGDCDAEIEQIKSRLAKTKETADAEMERLKKEEAEGTKDPEPPKSRSYRPTTMRRDTGASTLSKKKQTEVDDEGISDL